MKRSKIDDWWRHNCRKRQKFIFSTQNLVVHPESELDYELLERKNTERMVCSWKFYIFSLLFIQFLETAPKNWISGT